MNRLSRFVSLPGEEKRLLVRALLYVVVTRVALWVAPSRMLRNAARKNGGEAVERRNADGISVERIVRAVERVSRYVPKATCLTQALAAQVILAQEGHSTRLVIGVAKGDEGDLEAHAWVEHQERVVIGDSDELSRYTPLVGEGL